MRLAVLASILLLPLARPLGCDAQVRNDLADLKLSGKVKSLNQTDYKVTKVHGQLQNHYIGRVSYNFDEDGNKTKEYDYNADGTLDTKIVYVYDRKGQLTRENTYNAEGSPGFTNIYKYDNDDNLISAKVYTTAGTLFLKTVSDYDRKGNETQEINFKPMLETEVMINKTNWEYDANGNLSKEQFTESDSVVTRVVTYKYDAKGNQTERTNAENGTRIRTMSAYDDKGSVSEEVRYNEQNRLAGRTTYKYDEKGEETEESVFDKDNKLLIKLFYKLTYDKNGNWTRKTLTENDKTTMITDREIDYY